MDLSTTTNHDEYSASATTVNFSYPIPLIRGPIPASESDDPSSGPYVLAFRNPQSWVNAYKLSESKIISQCEGGARIGCVISTSEKCKTPWWRNLIGAKLADLKKRENCEEREMEKCLVVAKEKCVGFAKDKCFRPFSDARIIVANSLIEKCRNQRASELLASDPKYEWFFKPSKTVKSEI